MAQAQLLELRYYDERLDAELPRMYDRIEEARRTFGGLARRRYASLARSLHRLLAEVTEVSERIDNALVVTEDVYLARVYAGALERYRVHSWSSAVDQKLTIIRHTRPPTPPPRALGAPAGHGEHQLCSYRLSTRSAQE